MNSPAGAPLTPPPLPPKKLPVAGEDGVVNVLKKEPPAASEALVIRTIHDDLADLKKVAPAPAAKPVSPPAAPVRGTPPPRPVAAAAVFAPAAIPPRFPLPPRLSQGPVGQAGGQARSVGVGKTVATPPPKPKRHWMRRLVITFVVLVILGGLGAGGWYAWNNWQSVTQLVGPGAVVATAGEVLPVEVELLVRYDLASPEGRSAIGAAWRAASADETGGNAVSRLVAGDPTALLADPDLRELYYVVLPGEPRPYLVVPKTASSQQLLAALSGEQALEQNGWYVVHALRTDPYRQALAQGKRSDAPASAEGVVDGGPMEIEMSSTVLQQLRTAIAGKPFAAGQLNGLKVAGEFSADGGALAWRGSSSWQTPPRSAGAADQRFLTMVPADATLVRLGSNFQEDVARWQEVSQIIRQEDLAAPAVSNLVRQLATAYAYYHRLGPDGSLDLGLVIALPPALVGQLTLGEAAVENGLRALWPVLGDRPVVAPTAFTDATYNEVGLRYVNLISTTQTLDYAIREGYLLIATSKEGMHALVDVVKGDAPSLSAAPGWQDLLRRWGALPSAREVVLGGLNQAVLLQLLPHEPAVTMLPFGLAITARETAVVAEGIVQLAP